MYLVSYVEHGTYDTYIIKGVYHIITPPWSGFPSPIARQKEGANSAKNGGNSNSGNIGSSNNSAKRVPIVPKIVAIVMVAILAILAIVPRGCQ